MQNYSRIYDYIEEYQRLVYQTYSKHPISFLTTYYNIDTAETIWDDENMMDGPYESIGTLSGVKWKKYLLLPVFYIEDIQNIFDGQQIGVLKEGRTSFVFPSSYGFNPYFSDRLKLSQSFLRPTNDIYPVYVITGIEKSADTDKTFWKINCEVDQSETTTNLDLQVTDTYSFFEYDKKLHTVPDSQVLTKLLLKNESIKDNLKNLFDRNSGYYLL